MPRGRWRPNRTGNAPSSTRDGTLTARSRTGLDITAAYPELHDLADLLGGTPAILDGEIVALDEQGQPDFERLQSRMGLARSPARAARLTESLPAHLVLFDVMRLGNEDLMPHPWTERREALMSLGLRGRSWSVPTALVDHAARALEATRTAQIEGIVCNA